MVKLTRMGLSAFRLALQRFLDEQFAYRVSALAFTTLLALVPFVFVIMFAMSFFPSFSSVISLGEKYILTNFMPASASSIQDYFQDFIRQAGQLPFISIVFLFVTAIMMVNTIVDTLNDIWRVQERKNRLYSLFIFSIMLLLTPVIIGICLFLVAYLFTMQAIARAVSVFDLSRYILASLPILINTLIFSLLYILVPNTRVPWGAGLLGGLLAGVMFEAARYGFAFYVSRFPSYELIYGAFSILPLFLLWLYLFWFIVIFGALFTQSHVRLGNTP
ncbi:hypothetical protein AQUSIP_14320 [Aquicella siphonis]|uniref:Uncharacterized protein n=1 Tax=Aquicella siphonis TaxID=254247 RepID=A0A5E4PI79_9COXI|nr:YihY family inner membrane protein [Aquicella siphonis]VVC76127.1 hypothetical protein AQUSIP_14320 [Aquicella siphonis]